MMMFYRPFSSTLHQDDVSLPAGDAMASILPGKQLIPHGMRASLEEPRSQDITEDHLEPVSAGDTLSDAAAPLRAAGQGHPQGWSWGRGSCRPTSWCWALGAGQALPGSSSAPCWQEVSTYRLALKRMAGDMLSLHHQVTSLEVENGHLRRSLASRVELGHELLMDGDTDVMTREELLDRMATLKHQLVAGAAEVRRLKDRVQQLQNELIRKNDREKELVLLQRAHRQQQTALRRCQEKVAKMKGLEEVVRQQEKVVEVMERVLQEKLAGTGRSTGKLMGEGPSREVYTVLLAKNRRLREELARAPHHLPPIAPQPPALPGGFGGKEKLSLLARLEEAQARGRVLEKQLEEAARSWGREKQELGTRLLEQEHGFPHVPTTGSAEEPPSPGPPALIQPGTSGHQTLARKERVLFHMQKSQSKSEAKQSITRSVATGTTLGTPEHQGGAAAPTHPTAPWGSSRVGVVLVYLPHWRKHSLERAGVKAEMQQPRLWP
ncbi:coiled-coil domain-containing protein 33 [Guaruba guarouba]